MHITRCPGVLPYNEKAYARGNVATDTQVISLDEKRADNGYTLIWNYHDAFTYLFDMQGRDVPLMIGTNKDEAALFFSQ